MLLDFIERWASSGHFANKKISPLNSLGAFIQHDKLRGLELKYFGKFVEALKERIVVRKYCRAKLDFQNFEILTQLIEFFNLYIFMRKLYKIAKALVNTSLLFVLNSIYILILNELADLIRTLKLMQFSEDRNFSPPPNHRM